MSKTSIQWTETTWNPTVGCSVVSEGCKNCYAMKFAGRIELMGGKAGEKYKGLTQKTKNGAVWSGVVRLDPASQTIPLSWKQGRLVFVNSMSDLFHAALAWSDIDQVFAVMALGSQHVFQVLTKRPDLMRDYLNDPTTRARIELRMGMIAPGSTIPSWPLENVWCGTSIETQDWADARLPTLLATNAAVRFVSIEPLLAPVSLGAAVKAGSLPPSAIHGLHWIIVGGESGRNSRPMHPDWARSLRDEAVALRIPFFFKQFGQFSVHNPGGNRRCVYMMPSGQQVAHGAPGAMAFWNVGKKIAGEKLDGRLWQQMPRLRSAALAMKPRRTAKHWRTSDGARL